MQTGGIDPLIGKVFYVFISVVNLFLAVDVLELPARALRSRPDQATVRRHRRGRQRRRAGRARSCPISRCSSSAKAASCSSARRCSCSRSCASACCSSIWSERPVTAHGAADDDKPIGGNCIRRHHADRALAVFARHRTVHRRHLGRQHAALLRAVADRGGARSRTPPSAPACSHASTGSCRASRSSSQVFLTGRIATCFGVTALLTIVPVVMIFGFLVLAGSAGGFALFVVRLHPAACGRVRVRASGPRDAVEPARQGNQVQGQEHASTCRSTAAPTTSAARAGRRSREARRLAAVGMMVIGAIIAALWGLVGWWLGRRFEGGAPRSETVAPAPGAAQQSAT